MVKLNTLPIEQNFNNDKERKNDYGKPLKCLLVIVVHYKYVYSFLFMGDLRLIILIHSVFEKCSKNAECYFLEYENFFSTSVLQ